MILHMDWMEQKTYDLYLPGARVDALPESYRRWVGYYDTENISKEELPVLRPL